MRLGPDTGPVVVVALPLFEEANRTRAVATATMRALAAQGIAAALPDLPGQGESLLPTEAATLAVLREAFEGAIDAFRAADRPVYVAGIRSGALLDPFARAHGRWHLSPQDGPALLRELARIRQREVGRDRPAEVRSLDEASSAGAPIAIAGNLIGSGLLHELRAATPHDRRKVPERTIRLDGDPRSADRLLAAAPPWRRVEPANDDELAQALADDIVGWVRSCEGR